LAGAAHHTQSLRSIYFDTDGSAIRRTGYSLRVRADGKSFTQTVKTNGGLAGLFDRGEWEARVKRMALNADALKHSPLRNLKRLDRKAKPVVRAKVDRTAWVIEWNGSTVEAVLDMGSVSAGRLQAPIHELELELKDGKPAALFELAHELGRVMPLQLAVLSKEERGRMLTKGAFGHEHNASVVDLRRSMDAGQAFALIIHECIRHFRLNEDLIIADRNPAALHQARVAIRRLRTALAFFRPAVQQGSTEPLRSELRRFSRPFGNARNLDVFLESHAADLGASDRRRLTSARDGAYEEVIKILNGQRSRDMLLDIVEWAVSGDWRKHTAANRIDQFAARRLDEAWRTLKRKAIRIGDLDEKHLHRLRIRFKKLRYAGDFVAPLFARKRLRKFAGPLEDLQDCLGLIHDDIISRQIHSDFGLGGTTAPGATRRARQLKAIASNYKRLKNARPFWLD
jgi:triphosphatase